MPVTRGKHAAIDTVPTPEFEGMTFKRGKIVAKGGRYALQLGARRLEIPATVAPGKELKALEGATVWAGFSKAARGAIVAIGTWPTPEGPQRPRWILCYVPAPELMRRLDSRIRANLLRAMVEENIIPDAFARKVGSAG